MSNHNKAIWLNHHKTTYVSFMLGILSGILVPLIVIIALTLAG